MNKASFHLYLRKKLSERQTKNPTYSMRAFARSIGLGAGTLSEVLAGKRFLASKSIIRVLEKLEASPIERAKILNSPDQQLSYSQVQILNDQYFILSEWYYLAILNLLRIRGFTPTPVKIAVRLGISEREAELALERMLRTKLIRFNGKKLIRTSASLTTQSNIQNLGIRKFHQNSLERARSASEVHPFGTFDLSALIFAFNSNEMSEAISAIKRFQISFSELFSKTKDPDSVYQLSVQLFSLTKPH